VLGTNAFSDLSDEEFRSKLLNSTDSSINETSGTVLKTEDEVKALI